MEIKYTQENVDNKIFGQNKICGLLDKDGTYLKSIFSNMTNIKLPNLNVGILLKFKIPRKNQKILGDMLSELELTYILKKNIKELSTSELLKVQTLIAFLTPSKVVILSDIDSCLNNRDLKNLLKTLKNYIITLDKTVILETNKPDNLISTCERYIILENEQLLYNGDDFKKIPLDFTIKKFVELANQKGAKLDLYKDESDLLKAIYRSVKK